MILGGGAWLLGVLEKKRPPAREKIRAMAEPRSVRARRRASSRSTRTSRGRSARERPGRRRASRQAQDEACRREGEAEDGQVATKTVAKTAEKAAKPKPLIRGSDGSSRAEAHDGLRRAPPAAEHRAAVSVLLPAEHVTTAEHSSHATAARSSWRGPSGRSRSARGAYPRRARGLRRDRGRLGEAREDLGHEVDVVPRESREDERERAVVELHSQSLKRSSAARRRSFMRASASTALGLSGRGKRSARRAPRRRARARRGAEPLREDGPGARLTSSRRGVSAGRSTNGAAVSDSFVLEEGQHGAPPAEVAGELVHVLVLASSGDTPEEQWRRPPRR